MSDVKVKIKEKSMAKIPSVGLGKHPATSANAVIPRAFRWLLTCDHHESIHWWMKSIKTDYLNKKLTIEVFDDAKGDVFEWLNSLVNKSDKELRLVHLDATGTTIANIIFKDLSIVEHITEYDYSKNNILTHYVVIAYKSISRTNSSDDKKTQNTTLQCTEKQ